MTRELVDHRTIATTRPTVEREGERNQAADLAPRSGPAAAVIMAVGVASSVLGLLSVLTAASTAVSNALTLSDRVGDVSGVTTGAAFSFFATWGLLTAWWRRTDPALSRVAAAAALLIGLGLLGTFPPFFNLFGG